MGVQGVFGDVTEQKRAEESIREQAELLNLAGNAIIVRGPGGHTAFWIQGAERLYGWSAAGAAAQPVATLTGVEADRLMEIELGLQARSERNGELKQRTRAGGELPMNRSAEHCSA